MTQHDQRLRPFDAVRRALEDPAIDNPRSDPIDHGSGSDVVASGNLRLDPTRSERAGAPELILASRKPADQVVQAVGMLLERTGHVVVTRGPGETLDALDRAYGATEVVERYPASGIAIISRPNRQPPATGGRVAIISAGASDTAVAEEAAIVATELGCIVQRVEDVGVAGLHRLVRPLEDLVAWGADVVVVVAGMDGALPSVVTGLVSVPVIGVPVSTGYGYGGEGVGALMAMLQSCVPGLTVVNIDNGVGAGVAAARIANQAAALRAEP